ncbi:exporter of polyketide antibiotics [Virgisporangium ochraceum]|uniref:Exporter of polyketide antibiotics n=1 Tax=Virgisporangium ochraceum TaxID=65505 RepID=A0A8J3ZRC5_9ACTN|nr:anibiotic ABC transporter [Virgisporangium ochraceum]GIJ66533.1 exporter of polyketide antibiotics [Virgisporangium ochraceum]
MSGFTGTGSLLRLALRRDRIQIPVWLAAQAAVLGGSGSSIVGLYNTVEERESYATSTATSVVSVAFNGPTSGPSMGSIVTSETFLVSILLIAFMTTFMVVRHTRQNEETGRAEMVGAGAVGRYAMVTAALVLAVMTDVVFAGVSTLVLFGFELPAGGAVLYGVALCLAGITFAGVAAVTAQIAESARAANGLAAAFVGLSFLLRAVGDATGDVVRNGQYVESSWPSYLSPMGWAQQVRPFSDDRVVLLLPSVVLFGVLLYLTTVLAAHRDIGTGMMPVRPGPARAPRSLGSPLGLAWRLQRGSFLGWAIGLLVLGVSFGAVAKEVDAMVSGNEDLAEVIAQLGGTENLVKGYLSAILGIGVLIACGYVIQALLRMRSEEAGGMLEPVLATAVSRTRWLGAHVVCTLLGLIALVVLYGASLGFAYGLSSGDPGGETVTAIGAALVRLPAAMVIGALVVAVFGVLPRLAVPISWGVLAAAFLVMQLGAVLELPQVVLDLSPFTHVPNAPAAPVEALPLVVLTAAALAIGGTGLAVFRRRDLAM